MILYINIRGPQGSGKTIIAEEFARLLANAGLSATVDDIPIERSTRRPFANIDLESLRRVLSTIEIKTAT